LAAIVNPLVISLLRRFLKFPKSLSSTTLRHGVFMKTRITELLEIKHPIILGSVRPKRLESIARPGIATT
jgi:hypothetical protein